MDTSLARATDRLGRPTGPRRKHTVSEKLRMVEETGRPGASVAEVARRHGINANLLFGWRRLVRRGLLRSESAAPSLLPVRVETPTLTPRERIANALPRGSTATRRSSSGSIEIEFGDGVRVRLHGVVEAMTLKRVLDALARR